MAPVLDSAQICTVSVAPLVGSPKFAPAIWIAAVVLGCIEFGVML
jgi:hypothetical protein